MATAATAANINTDRKAMMRDKRAQGIAAMGLVNREGDRFRVTTPSLRGRRSSYEVWRDEEGKVRCSCLEFEEESARGESGFRCEHILAVKHSLLAKNSEPVTKQQQPAAGAAATISTAQQTPNTETHTASEKRDDHTTEPAIEAGEAARFGREQHDDELAETAIENLAFARPASALADNTDAEEQTEMNQQQAVYAPEMPEQDFDFVTAEEHGAATAAASNNPASIVPLAFANTLRQLRQPIDPKLVKTREGWKDHQGNPHMVEYVEWHTVADLLDRTVPAWSHSVRGIVQIGDMVAVTVAITIDGVTREGVGTGTADNETGIKKAEHDALKRAAIKFGIARDLYQRESEVIETEGQGPQAGDFPRDPLAKSMSDLVTPKQLGMIRALAREAGIEPDDECRQVMRCGTEELSKRAASSFIDHLKNLQGQREQQQPMRRAS